VWGRGVRVWAMRDEGSFNVFAGKKKPRGVGGNGGGGVVKRKGRGRINSVKSL